MTHIMQAEVQAVCAQEPLHTLTLYCWYCDIKVPSCIVSFRAHFCAFVICTAHSAWSSPSRCNV